jgi:L-alanine-DL-glutamate epimerase-like enolase superfamily enzyme
MILKYKSFNLPFQFPFTISKGTKTHQPTLVLSLQLGNWIGYGEAPAINYYNISVEKMISDLESKRNMVEKFAFTSPDRYWHYLHHLFPNNPFLVCALDMASWDLYGKMQKKSLKDLISKNYNNQIQTDYTIGIDSIDKMIHKVKDKPWPIYKIKVGFENDIQIVKEICNNTNAIIRVDANAGWTVNEAISKIKELSLLNVELVEQPIDKDDWEGMKYLFQHSPLPLIADESCVSESDVEKCINHFHGINIKLTKCSGITPALKMIEQARKNNLKVMMGCMNESSIGSAAIAHFIPQLDYVDMDGPLLLKEDLASGIHFDFGNVLVNNSPGLGIQILENSQF